MKVFVCNTADMFSLFLVLNCTMGVFRPQGPGMTLEEVEACLASPVVASPPALLRPGVGATARRVWPGPPRGRGLLRRNSASGSYTSYRQV